MAAIVVGTLVLAATGNVDAAADGDLSLAIIALLQIPLWAGYLGVPIWVARTKGHGVVADYGLRQRPVDVLSGLGSGLATQFLLIPIAYLLIVFPLMEAFGWDGERDLSDAARELTDKANDPVGVVLLVLVVAIAAPVIEELFFRGLLLRAFEKRWGSGWALAGSSLIFGAVHLQALQFPALALVGLVLGAMTLKTGRLGPAIWAHIAFNGAATAQLLAQRS